MKNVVIKAILAGIAIGIGGTIYLSSSNKVVGAALFGIGLYVIVTRSLNLFTGKIGYVTEKKNILEMILILAGNFIGTFITGVSLIYTRIAPNIVNAAKSVSEAKLDDNLLSIFILSVFCGILMFIAVDGYKKLKNPLIVFLPVIVFILCGFEHCIANMYYFTVAEIWSLKTVIYTLVMVLGNTTGAVIFNVLCGKSKDKEEVKYLNCGK